MAASQQNPIIIISGPAGVGKTTIAKALQRNHPNLETSVTYTTREPRPESPEDKKIYYITPTEFENMITAGEFLEWAKVHGQYYGTHKQKTFDKLKTHPVIFNVDVQGAKQIMEKIADHPLISIFLEPESIEQIKERIIKRGHSDPADLARRLESADKELKEKGRYQYQIINNEGRVKHTIIQIEKILAPYLHPKNSLISQIRLFFRF